MTASPSLTVRNPADRETAAHLLLLAVAAVWGITFVLVKDALVDASPLLFNLLRMSLASLALLAVNRRSLVGLSRSALLSGLAAGCLLATGYQFQTAGLALTTPAKSAFLTGLVVVFVPLLSAIPGLRPTGSAPPGYAAAAGALVAFSGLFLLTTPGATPIGQLFSKLNRGDLLTLACALAFAGHLMLLARVSPRIPARQLGTLQVVAATGLMAVTLPLGGPLHLHLTARLVLAVAITGLFATAAAFTIQSWAQQHLPPTHTALTLALEPVFAAVTSLLVLHEHLTHRALGGAALILAGIAITELAGRPPLAQLQPINPAVDPGQ